MMDVSRRDFIKGAVATAAVAGLTPEAYAARWFGADSSAHTGDEKGR